MMLKGAIIRLKREATFRERDFTEILSGVPAPELTGTSRGPRMPVT